jgi:hypothetical protein
MKITIVHSFAGLDTDELGRKNAYGFTGGETHEVPDRLALKLISEGHAKEADEAEVKKSKTPSPETATMNVPAHAVALPAARGKK